MLVTSRPILIYYDRKLKMGVDELFENIDAEGVKDLMTLLKDKLSTKNVFVITQRFDEFFDLFFSSIKFQQNIDGFTEIVQ